ncbi:MAG: glycoside hydrolase family 88 protein [Candidatus Glassbacteria bacterium]|nr:glycoside hydrolase family 88 protein [Candidatus Glassbacteria bacterium]
MVIFIMLSGCAGPEIRFPRIGVIGTEGSAQRVDEALPRMGEPFAVIDSVSPAALAGYDLVILGPGAFSRNDAGVAGSYRDLLAYVEKGGCLLAFGLSDRGYRPEFLPYEVRFDPEDPSGWGNVDFSEQIDEPDHPVFNSPHRLTYLAGLEESSRIVYTAPEWRILLSKDPRHPSQDTRIEKLDNSVGSLFEADWGKGHILVCQPIIDRYYAGKASIVPHPLEQGVLLFENVVEYMKRKASGRDLPLVTVKACPGTGAPGRPVLFEAVIAGGAGEPYSYDWDFGDGTRSSEPAPQHEYGREGVYWATATVADAKGRADHAACRVEAGPARAMRWADQLVAAQMHRYYPDPSRVGVNYRTALLLSGMLDVYRRTADREILDYLRAFFQARLIERWGKRPYKNDMQPDVNFVDIYSLMAPAYRIYRITGDSACLEMAEEVWRQSVAVDRSRPPGSLWSPWTWGGREAIVDFTYFKAQLRADLWEETGDISLLDEAAEQMVRFTDYMLDPADSLFFQAIDLDRKAYFCSETRPTGLCDSKWGRGNGWVALAFAELMPRLPASHPRRAELTRIVRGFFNGILRTQDPVTGLWALITDKLDYPGMWLETTSTSMFVYSMVVLVECSVLPEEPFLASARRGYNGLQQRIRMGAFSYPYLSDACQGSSARVNMGRWLQAHRHDNDYHVLGPFLMAEEALWRAAPPEVAVVGTLRPSRSGLGPLLNRAGLYFYQVPNLYTAGELGAFGAVVVDRGALDRNDADIRAYCGSLLDYAAAGGTLVYFPQDNPDLLLEALPPGIAFKRAADGYAVPETGSGWLAVSLGPEKQAGLVVTGHGRGKVVYCSVCPAVSTGDGAGSPEGWPREFLDFFKGLAAPAK